MASESLNILSLPSEIIELVLLYCSYDEISMYRLVRKICRMLLLLHCL